MLRGNLSTRPFYNERLVGGVLAIVALCAILFTAFNAWRLIALSSERNALRTRIDHDRSEAARVRKEADAIQQAVNPRTLTALADAAREANELIDRRTFSWTGFFSVIEHTMPMNVRLAMVSPRVDKGNFKVAMTVVARDLGDITEFMDALQGTGAFYDVIPADQQLREDATYAASILASYIPPKAPATPPVPVPPTPAPGGKPPGPATPGGAAKPAATGRQAP